MTAATICFPFCGTPIGGSHISAAGMIAGLDPTRFRPLVALQNDRGPAAELLGRYGIAFVRAPATPLLAHGRPVGPGMVARLLAATPRLVRFLKQRQVDIVHCNDGRTLATWALAARLAGARLVWHHRGSPRAAGLRFVAPALADQVIAVSHFAAPAPGLYSAADRTVVIHSPFDTDTRHDRGEARALVAALFPDAGPATRFVAFSGALIARKRPQLFVETIAALRRALPGEDIRGVILGEALDDTGTRLTSRARELGIADQVVLAGFRTPGPLWLAGCDLLLVPAIDEPFGRTLIEAMLAGTAVVATASGGNLEAISHGRTGLLAPPEDAEQLAQACARLLQDPELTARIVAEARSEARVRYGAAMHVRAVGEVYDRLLADRRRKRANAHELEPTETAAADLALQEQVSR